MKYLHFAAALSLVLLGCGGVFGPRFDPAKPSEAEYDLRDESSSFGSAIVVADPPEDVEIDGKPRATIALSVFVDNTSDEEIALRGREVELAWVITTAGRIEGEAVHVLHRKVSIVEDGVAEVDAAFALPEGYTASQIRAFGVRWSFERAGERYGELTAFGLPSDRGGTSLATQGTPVVLYSPYTYGYAAPLMDGTYYDATPGFGVYTGPSGYPYPSYSYPSGPPVHVPAQPSISVDRVPAHPTLSR
jgi:hypothetical protein